MRASMGDVLTDQQIAALRTAFDDLDYTVDHVVGTIGEEAHRALARNSTVAAVRALVNRRDPIAILTSLWPLQQPVGRDDAERALPGLVQPLIDAGMLSGSANEVRAEVDIRPYGSDDGAGGWVVSDLSPNLDGIVAPIRPDFVLGVSSASTTLAQLTVREPVGRALDLGTGCGVQALHLARHAGTIVATDLNPRALTLAAVTLGLNQVAADLRLGDLYEPVGNEQFDLITTNPPYVMSPPRTEAERLTYREGNHAADGLVEQVVRRGVEHLSDGGTLQVLGNWAHPVNGDWQERLQGWVEPTGCDAHVVQRETLDPCEYIEIWLADAGLAGSPEYARRYAEWLDYFQQLGIAGVGMGWITLHRTNRDVPRLDFEDWPYPLEQPIGPAVRAHRLGVEIERQLSDADLLGRRWTLAADVIQESIALPGSADPQHVVFRQQRGFRRAVEADTSLAGILGACDGELPLGQVVDAVARILSVDPVALRAETLPRVRQLIRTALLS